LWAGHSLAAHTHLAAQRRGVKESKKKRREGEGKEGREGEGRRGEKERERRGEKERGRRGEGEERRGERKEKRGKRKGNVVEREVGKGRTKRRKRGGGNLMSHEKSLSVRLCNVIAWLYTGHANSRVLPCQLTPAFDHLKLL